MKASRPGIHSRYQIALGLAAAVAAGCGAAGSSSTGDPSGAGGDTTATGTMTGTSTTGTMAGTGGSGACPSQSVTDVATHITLDVTWPGTVGINPGAGQVHIWTLSTQTIDASNITGTVRPCGSLIPDLMGTIIVGGMMIGNTIADLAWESPSMPMSAVSGTHSGFAVGSTVTINKNATVVGATMVNSLMDAWPMMYSGLMTADSDGDGKPGLTATPKTAPGFQLPPVNLFMNPKADLLYLATRSIISLSGTRDTCNTVTGTATVEKFDNHVVGCHIQGGGECMPAEAQFVDDNRTIFMIGTAIYRAANLPTGSTCTDARAALP